MLSWFTGAPKLTEEHAPFKGDLKTFLRNRDRNLPMSDDISGVEGAPDTPAPQFALRALKSAFLGTPHAIQSMGKGQQQASLDENPKKSWVDAQLGCDEWRNSPPENSKRSRKNPPLSPAKGILLTPGTAAIKRKTVSFGEVARSGEQKDDIFAGQTIVGTGEGRFSVNPASAGSPKEKQEIQHVLSKTKFESRLQASKRRIGKRANSKDHVVGNNTERRGTPKESQESSQEILPDTTIDLNVPCSRSGKHWKGEYDQYQRKSNREMRRLIQHGQTIKSYAQKKDSEATGLHEKLNRELAKVASMEAKVSDLAIELASARSRSAPGDGESAQLMTDLAKQTATAIRSKQKAERYKAALEAHDVLMRLPESRDDCVQTIDANASKHPAQQVECLEIDTLRTELSNLKLTFRAVEEKATKLENENMALKQRMARVKMEMQSYEHRRHVREERLARKQGNLLTAKEKIEAKFEQLKIEHEQLQRVHQLSVDEGGQKAILDSKSLQGECRMSAATRVHQRMLGDATNLPSSEGPMKSLEEKHAALAPESTLQRPTSPLAQSSPSKTRTNSFNNEKAIESGTTTSPNPQESSVDIWTYDPQNGLTDGTLPSGENSPNSDYTLLRRSTYAALQEISQNSISEQQPHHQPSSPQIKPLPGSAAPAMTLHKPHFPPAALQVDSRRPTIVSPRPSFVSIASSAQKPDMQRFRSDSGHHRADHRSSILSTGTRTSTLGSRRALPLDRAEAARKRLEAKRREKAAR